ncbi:MAG TPA: mechanosensitive ion channel family protein [Steroidobacter sp.]|jgi:small-conductance mechanosensitive channel|nr:mechanosensitive ion channel family protein [Steroidobacteraceae bacterium]HLS82649.1 mechanosensitive ion channel family protein [Steroidobacter sp.]
MSEKLLQSIQDWMALVGPAGKVLLILLGAWVLRKIVRATIAQLGARSIVPTELVLGLRRTASVLITFTALLLVLQTLGVSPAVMWTALTGFVAVAAVAFFAAWSVLSNIFCTFLIVATRPFRLHDHIEVLEGGDKPGLRGQVIDINLIYTSLKEASADGEAGCVLQVPNNLFFQRIVRRWRGAAPPNVSAPLCKRSEQPTAAST